MNKKYFIAFLSLHHCGTRWQEPQTCTVNEVQHATNLTCNVTAALRGCPPIKYNIFSCVSYIYSCYYLTISSGHDLFSSTSPASLVFLSFSVVHSSHSSVFLGRWWEINSSLNVRVSTSWLRHLNINYTPNFVAKDRNRVYVCVADVYLCISECWMLANMAIVFMCVWLTVCVSVCRGGHDERCMWAPSVSVHSAVLYCDARLCSCVSVCYRGDEGRCCLTLSTHLLLSVGRHTDQTTKSG